MNVTQLFADIADGRRDDVAQQLDEAPWLTHVPNPNTEAWDESSVLHCAAKHGQLEITELLVERGALVYSHPHNSYPAVIIAAWNKHQDVVDYYLQKIPDRADGTNGLGVTVNLAARQGWTDLVRQHIAADPLAVHQRGWIGDSPLHWPAHNGCVDVVEVLLDAGAHIEADEINAYGGKPLHWASEHEPATVELLLKWGADVNARNIKPGDYEGFTPLIMNASQGDDCAEATELLIAAGADIFATDSKGRTPLDLATEKGLTRIPGVLKKHGA